MRAKRQRGARSSKDMTVDSEAAASLELVLQLYNTQTSGQYTQVFFAIFRVFF